MGKMMSKMAGGGVKGLMRQNVRCDGRMGGGGMPPGGMMR